MNFVEKLQVKCLSLHHVVILDNPNAQSKYWLWYAINQFGDKTSRSRTSINITLGSTVIPLRLSVRNLSTSKVPMLSSKLLLRELRKCPVTPWKLTCWSKEIQEWIKLLSSLKLLRTNTTYQNLVLCLWEKTTNAWRWFGTTRKPDNS